MGVFCGPGQGAELGDFGLDEDLKFGVVVIMRLAHLDTIHSGFFAMME